MRKLDVSTYGVEEMRQQDLKTINGGIGVVETIIAGAIVAAAAQIISDWDNFKAGLFGREEIKSK